jgi:hypothetical protein
VENLVRETVEEVAVAPGAVPEHNRGNSDKPGLHERRRRAEQLLRDQPGLSDRTISKESGLARATVANMRAALERAGEIDYASQRVRSDGRTFSERVERRQPGELPEPDLGEIVSDGLKGLFMSRERRRARKSVRYLQHLLVALNDQYELPSWETATDTAAACLEVLGADKAREFATRLAPPLQNVTDVVRALNARLATPSPHKQQEKLP